MLYNSNELIEKVKLVSPKGFQVFTKRGLLTSTKTIYFREEEKKIYLFNIEDDFLFIDRYGYYEEEFIEDYKNYLWVIDIIID